MTKPKRHLMTLELDFTVEYHASIDDGSGVDALAFEDVTVYLGGIDVTAAMSQADLRAIEDDLLDRAKDEAIEAMNYDDGSRYGD